MRNRTEGVGEKGSYSPDFKYQIIVGVIDMFPCDYPTACGRYSKV